jgi:hypothetical protein
MWIAERINPTGRVQAERHVGRIALIKSCGLYKRPGIGLAYHYLDDRATAWIYSHPQYVKSVFKLRVDLMLIVAVILLAQKNRHNSTEESDEG